MTAQPTVRAVSPRWHAPERSEDGTYWRARIREPETVDVLERAAYGPDIAACVRETERLDRTWARTSPPPNATETAPIRLPCLTGEDGGDAR